MSHKNCQCFSYQPWLLDVANNILGKLDNEKIVCFQMCHDKPIHIFCNSCYLHFEKILSCPNLLSTYLHILILFSLDFNAVFSFNVKLKSWKGHEIMYSESCNLKLAPVIFQNVWICIIVCIFHRSSFSWKMVLHARKVACQWCVEIKLDSEHFVSHNS